MGFPAWRRRLPRNNPEENSMYNAQTSTLIHDSLDAMHRSALACFAAGDGLVRLTHQHSRSVVDIAQRKLCGEPPATPQQWFAAMLDSDLPIASRAVCVQAAEHVGEASDALIEAARAVIECSQVWLLGQMAYDESVGEDAGPAAKPRRRQLAA